jgi:transcriptional regulator
VIDRTDLLQGTLDLLVLRTLRLGPLHGWGISKRIRQLSSDALQVNQGSLYPALYRLQDKGWIAAEWGTSEDGRRIKLYSLTAAGRKRALEERRAWRAFATAVDRLLEET